MRKGLNIVNFIINAFLGHVRSPISKKVQTKPVSPFQGSPDGDRGSPNKSPSQQTIVKSSQSSNFNPNAPTFVPMGMQGGSANVS